MERSGRKVGGEGERGREREREGEGERKRNLYYVYFIYGHKGLISVTIYILLST